MLNKVPAFEKFTPSYSFSNNNILSIDKLIQVWGDNEAIFLIFSDKSFYPTKVLTKKNTKKYTKAATTPIINIQKNILIDFI